MPDANQNTSERGDQPRNVDELWMRRALELAERGRGRVEPNPMVGCVVVRDGKEIGSGWHDRFGGPHAEVNALSELSSVDLRDAEVYVTLEPCSHHGKTPPCLDLLLKLKPRRVVVAGQDPFPQVAGRGIEGLRSAGIEVDVGIMEAEARWLNAPYFKRTEHGLPWVIAKWAMTLDGAIATRSGDSKWVTSEASRAEVHKLRARVDAIVVGSETVLVDDPLLTARPNDSDPSTDAGINPDLSSVPTLNPPRVLTRVVLDRRFRIPADCQLAKTAQSYPLCIVTEQISVDAKMAKARALQGMGAEVVAVPSDLDVPFLEWVLRWLCERGVTNVLVEGGGRLLGALFDGGWVDQVECFIAPRVLGDEHARRPVQGNGRHWMNQTQELVRTQIKACGPDIHVRGYVPQTRPVR